MARGDAADQLELMDGIYAADDGHGGPAIFKSVGKAKKSAYWGRPCAVASHREPGFAVGIRAKIWALCLLAACHIDEDFNARALCKRIGSRARKSQAGLVEQVVRCAADERGRRTSTRHATVFVEELLYQLVSEQQKEACPPVAAADDLLRFVSDYCAFHLFRDGGDIIDEGAVGAFNRLLAADYRAPSLVYCALRETLPASIAAKKKTVEANSAQLSRRSHELEERLAKLSYVDPSIDRGVTENAYASGRRYAELREDDETDEVVADLFVALKNHSPRKRRLFVLSGPPFAGKKTKINSLLRAIAANCDDRLLIRLVANSNAGVATLPVRAWSAKGVHYRQLVSDVVQFLEQYLETRQDIDLVERRLKRANATSTTFEELFELVRFLHPGNPALYIFTDVDAFQADYDRHAVRDIGIKRLIEALLTSNRDSMVVVTTTENLDRTVGLPQFRRIEVKSPHVLEIPLFVRQEIRSEIRQQLFYLDYKELRGDDLLCIATLINLSDGLPDDALAACTAFLQKPPDERSAPRADIYRHLIRVIEKESMLHPIALIAASEDGLRDETLNLLLSRWSRHDKSVAAFRENVDASLRALAAKAGRRFLLRSRIVRYDAEEYGFHETHAESDEIWEIDSLISAMFLEALLLEYPELARQSHRLIAAAARERAQTKKVMMRSPFGSRATEDASRDIQCFVSLLASIDLPAKEEPYDELPLRLSEDVVFSLDQRIFSARTALRFAVMCLLQEDIDHDYRLTMVFDEDALRLDLYLLVFQELGRQHHTLLGPRTLPDSLPRHLSVAYFPDDQIIELLGTVALSAFHAQRFDVVHGAASLANSFVRQRKISNYPAKIVRIWCSQIDAFILKGGMTDDGQGHLDTLAFVRTLRATHFDTLDNVAKLPWPRTEEAQRIRLAELKANMRLLAREAELCGLVDKTREQAQRLYEELERLESLLSGRFSQHDPVVLSGRVARRYIRFLLRPPVLAKHLGSEGYLEEENQATRSASISRAKDLISVNISRLRRFSGADRVGVMLDLARLKLAEGMPGVALKWAHAAYVRAFNGGVSHGGKLEALAVYADLNIRNAQHVADTAHQADKAAAYMEVALSAANDLHRFADRLGYLPLVGIAQYLLSVTHLFQYQKGKLSGRHSQRDRKNLDESYRNLIAAKKLMKKIGDLSLDDEINEAHLLIVGVIDSEAHR